MERRNFLKLLPAGIAAAGFSPAFAAPASRPNVLLLFPDQWRFDWSSTNRALPIRTPNIDRLRAAGTEFGNAIVAAPVCAASRACLASGREYDRALTPSNSYDFPYARLNTFYSQLRQGGYHVMACGKMDLTKAAHWWGLDGKWRLGVLGFSDGINNAGKFDQLIGYQLNNNQPADPYLAFLSRRGAMDRHLDDLRKRITGGYAATFPTPLSDDAYCDNWLTGNGLDLIDSVPHGKPWFLQVNWVGPHNPEDITASMESTVRGRTMPQVVGSNQYSAPVNRLIRQNYTAMCENIDRTIGLYLKKLADRGELENTIVIFSSDHGEMLGDHNRWGKSVPYHASASVPLIAAGPGIRRGVHSQALVSIMDLAATSLDYAGLAVPASMDSRSLRPVLEGRSRSHREIVFSGLGGWRMAFDGQYKVVTGFKPDRLNVNDDWTAASKEVAGLPPLAYDLAADPHETADIGSRMSAAAARLLLALQHSQPTA